MNEYDYLVNYMKALHLEYRCHNIIWSIYCYSLEKVAWKWKSIHCLENICATATLLKNIVSSQWFRYF